MHDPADAADAHFASLEREAARECRWWRANKAHILALAAAAMHTRVPQTYSDAAALVARCADVVRAVTTNCEDPYTGEE